MSISLVKGQKISLAKDSGAALSRVIMGLGWDVKKVRGLFGGLKDGPEIDLDASCAVFDEGKNLLDSIWFKQLNSKDGNIKHTGDNRTGAGDGDDEQIIVELANLAPTVKSLVFVVNSFTGQSFAKIENAFCRIVDASNNQEVARFELSSQGEHTAQIMAKVYRHNGEWKMHAIGENTSARTFHELMPAILPHL